MHAITKQYYVCTNVYTRKTCRQTDRNVYETNPGRGNYYMPTLEALGYTHIACPFSGGWLEMIHVNKFSRVRELCPPHLWRQRIVWMAFRLCRSNVVMSWICIFHSGDVINICGYEFSKLSRLQNNSKNDIVLRKITLVLQFNSRNKLH